MSELGAAGIEAFSAPISVFLNLTRQCNMRCLYCYAETERESPEAGRELRDDEFLSLTDQLIEAKVFRVAITGGEPFLRRDLLFSILDRIIERTHVLLFTNGTLITEEDARRLSAWKNRIAFFLSIDAPVEEINAITRGKGFLQKTLTGAKRLMDEGVTPDVSCVLSRTNYQFIPDLIDFLRRLGLKRLHIIHLQPIGYGSSMVDLALHREERLAFAQDVDRWQREQSGVKIIAGDDESWYGFERLYQTCAARSLLGQPAPSLLPCSAGVDQCNITADGWVTPCNYLMPYRCGNVRETPFLDIWRNSPGLKQLRSLRRTPVTAIKECADCRYSLFCRGGCRAIAFVTSGDLLGWDPSCPYRPVLNDCAMPRLPIVTG